MFLSVYEAYKRKDVFLDMFTLYTLYLLRDQDERKLEIPNSPIQKKRCQLRDLQQMARRPK